MKFKYLYVSLLFIMCGKTYAFERIVEPMGKVFFVLEELDSKNVAFWSDYFRFMAKLAKEAEKFHMVFPSKEKYHATLFVNPKTGKPTEKINRLVLVRSGTSPAETLLNMYQEKVKGSYWIAYISSKKSIPSSESDWKYITYTMGVVTSEAAPFASHTGISVSILTSLMTDLNYVFERADETSIGDEIPIKVSEIGLETVLNQLPMYRDLTADQKIRYGLTKESFAEVEVPSAISGELHSFAAKNMRKISKARSWAEKLFMINRPLEGMGEILKKKYPGKFQIFSDTKSLGPKEYAQLADKTDIEFYLFGADKSYRILKSDPDKLSLDWYFLNQYLISMGPLTIVDYQAMAGEK